MKRKVFILVLMALLCISMMPVGAYAYSSDQDKGYIDTNVRYIADFIDENGSYDDDDGCYWIALQNNDKIFSWINNKGDQLEYVMSYDSDDDGRGDSFASMYVTIPTNGDVDLEIVINVSSLRLTATATIDPSEFVRDGNDIDFYKEAGNVTLDGTDQLGNSLFNLAYTAWDQLMTEQIGMPLSSLGFSEECNHSWDDGYAVTEATCTKDGSTVYTCIYCGLETYEDEPAIGHDYDNGKVTKKAGKDTKGTITYTCQNNSSHTKTKTIPALKLTIKAKKSTFNVKAKDLKKKAQTIESPIKVKGAKTKVTYTKVSGKSNFKVNKTTGKITIKKGTKKGTYKVKVKVKTASNSKYKATTTTVTLKIKVK